MTVSFKSAATTILFYFLVKLLNILSFLIFISTIFAFSDSFQSQIRIIILYIRGY